MSRAAMPGFFVPGPQLRQLATLLPATGERRGGMAAGLLLLLLLLLLLPTCGAPALAMLANPIEQCAFKADVVTEPLRFEPFVLQDLFAFGEEFLIQTGLFHELP